MGVFGSADAGRACGLRRRFCAHLFTVLESRPSSAQHSVVGPPVEMTQSAVPRGLAGLQAMRRITATEVHRRLVSGCNGHGRWQALAGGGHRRGAGVIPAHGPGVEKGPRTTACMGGRTCTGAKPFKGDPAMRLLGQEPLRKGQVHQRMAGFVRRA